MAAATMLGGMGGIVAHSIAWVGEDGRMAPSDRAGDSEQAAAAGANARPGVIQGGDGSRRCCLKWDR